MKIRKIVYAVLCLGIFGGGAAAIPPARAAALSENLVPIAGSAYCSVNGCGPFRMGGVPTTATTTLYLYSSIKLQGWCSPPSITAYRDAALTEPVTGFGGSLMWQSPTSTFPCSYATTQSGDIAVEYDNISLDAGLFYALGANAGDTSRAVYLPFTDASGTFAYYRLADNLNDAFGVLTAKEPVVIVPGIMGSVLDRAADGAEVWPNAAKMLLSGTDRYLDDLKLSLNGAETEPLVAKDVVRQELTVPFYRQLIRSLEDDGYAEGSTFFIAPYDWRMSVASSAAAIAPVLAEARAASPDGEVNVVAHSMGGLVMKEFLKDATSSFVHKLILAGVPQIGAPTAFKLLNYGDDLGMNVLGFGLNQDEVQAISQNMPGVYDLLPSRRYVAVNGGYVEDFRSGTPAVLDYDRTGALLSNHALAARADAWHGLFDGDQFGISSSSVYNILGCGEDTLGTIRMYDGGTYAIDPTKGDGTVPLTSAFNFAEGYQNFFDLGDDHAGLVGKSAPLALIRDILDGVTSTAIGGISPSLGDCFVPDELLISVNGPAELHIFDGSGRHTGPNDASGTIDLSIPSSSYEAIGENFFVALPARGAPYRVEADAIASGTITLVTESLSNTVPKKKTTYVSVKLSKRKAKATLEVTATGTGPALAVDADADGVPDASVPPTAVIDVSSTPMDVDPPVLSVPAMPTSTIAGATTTLLWGVADAGSGVATSTATMDGVPVANGQIVAFGEAGTSTLIVTAVDNAGNPAAREVDFTVLPPPRACFGHSLRRGI